MGWASGFAAGSQMAQGWLDTYDEVKTRKNQGLANEEIRKMQQGTTPTQGAQTAPQMSPNPMATAATAPIDISAPAGGLGTAPQMSPVEAAPTEERMTMQNIMAQQPQSTEQVRGRMTGLGRAENQLGEESQILDIYRKYNLTEDIASQEDKISGLQTRYDDLSQYEREAATAAEKTAYDREQNKLVNDRLQSELNSVVEYRKQQTKASEQAVGYEKAKQRREELDRDARGAMMGAAVNGMTMSEMASQVPEEYRENPAEWQNAIAEQYMEASGLTATDFSQIVKNIISPIDKLLNTTYTSEKAKIDEYNKRLSGLDPDASDDLIPELSQKDDGSWGVTYNGATIMEGDTPEDIARQYKESVAASPFGHALDRIDFLRVEALKNARNLTTAESKRDFLTKLAKDNPAILRDKTLRDELLTSVGFEIDGGIDTTDSRWASATSSIQGYGGVEDPEALTAVQAAAAGLAQSEQEREKQATTDQQALNARQANADAANPQIIFALTDDGIEETFGGAGIKPSRAQRIALQVRMNGGDLQDYEASIGKGLGGNLVIGGVNTGIRTVN